MTRWFASRIERRVAVMLILGAALPIMLLSGYALWQLRSQTLDSAEIHLKSLAKQYGQQIIERLRFANAEVEYRMLLELGEPAGTAPAYPALVDLADAPTRLLIDPEFHPELKLERSRLRYRDGALRLEVPVLDGAAVGLIPASQLFYDLSDLPSGFHRCVDIGEVANPCARGFPQEWVVASWPLYLQGVFGADFNLSLTMAQPRETVLAGLTVTAQVLPIVILLVAALVCWLILRQLRLQLGPVAALRSGAAAIARGEYTHRVDVHTGDEFEGLSDAFNEMATSVSASVQTLSALSTIDQLILSGANLQRVLHEAVELCADICHAPVAVLLADPFSGESYLASTDSGSGLVQTPLAEGLAEALNRRPLDARDFALMLEDRQVGALRVTGEITASEQDRLDELAHRLSVAITNLKRSENLYQQANFDALTGLLNRHALLGRLEDGIHQAQRNAGKLALLYLDLDGFKAINDTEGHATGDALLQLVADRLRSESRAVDAIARLGGDEFALVITDVKDQTVLAGLCERLIRALSDQVVLDRIEHSLNASLGIALYPQDGADSATLLRNADTAMYKAKSQGGAGYAFFDPSLHQVAERKVVMQSKLRRAIGTAAVYCDIQPKLHIASGRLLGAEALMRWRDAELGLVRPDEFIPLAEETGLIHDLTEVLLLEARACLAAMGPRPDGFRLAINLSPKQLALPTFAEDFLARIQAFVLDPATLELEVTESCFSEDAETLIDNLTALRAAGFTIAMDDFGTGYSSLTLLKQLPIDTLKLDRAFLSGMTEDDKVRQMVGKVIEMAKILELDVVAEGAESEEDVRVLTELGCDFVQGYVIARPMHIPDWAEMLPEVPPRVVKLAR